VARPLAGVNAAAIEARSASIRAACAVDAPAPRHAMITGPPRARLDLAAAFALNPGGRKRQSMAETSAYLPAGIVDLHPDEITQGYWDAVSQRKLAIQQCVHCKTFRHLPTPTCPKCYSFDFEYTEVSGKGTVFSYTIPYHPVHPALREHGPYNVVTVTLDDAPVRLVSNLVGVANEDIKIGMPVEVLFEEQAPGVLIPRFKPRA
jgi:hypothetical protein